jgi:hypothetical protein
LCARLRRRVGWRWRCDADRRRDTRICHHAYGRRDACLRWISRRRRRFLSPSARYS